MNGVIINNGCRIDPRHLMALAENVKNQADDRPEPASANRKIRAWRTIFVSWWPG